MESATCLHFYEHCTESCYFGSLSFSYAVWKSSKSHVFLSCSRGVNLVPFLEYLGFPDKVVKLLENSQSGYALTAYAMYKVGLYISSITNKWMDFTKLCHLDFFVSFSEDRHSCEVHGNIRRNVTLCEVSEEARLHVHSSTCERISPGEDGGDQRENLGENGRD